MSQKRRKCQAKNPAACCDPMCPEKRNGQHALARAISVGDFDAYIAQRDAQKKRLRAQFLEQATIASDWDKLYVIDQDTSHIFNISVMPDIKGTYPHDLSVIEHFDSFEDINAYYRKIPDVLVRLNNNFGPYTETSLPGFSLASFYVSPALRGQSIGSHIMKTLTTHADEHNQVIELVPTNAGDGKLPESHPQWRAAALDHRTKLIAFYESHGFELNPFYHYMGNVDYLTQKPYEIDEEAQKKFTSKAKKILEYHSMYIRFPKSGYPKGWLARS